MPDFEITPQGPFTLASAARFIAGWPPSGQDAVDEQTVRLAFLVDDWSGHAAVTLRQGTSGVVEGEIHHSTATDAGRVREQAARILSLDHDGRGYAQLGEREPLISELQQSSGWLRPVLFHSPFEAACWGVISTRLRQPIAVGIRERLSTLHGATLNLADREMTAFPTPEQLLAVQEFDGIPAEKLGRLHGIAVAALEGRLDRTRLLGMDPEEATRELLQLPGIGPFWSQAILLRAVGPTDGVTLIEPRVRRRAAELYGEPAVAEDDGAFLALADRWRPFRTWTTVLLRATA